MSLPIYLDYAATTPVDTRVADKMLKFLTGPGGFGNAASDHALGAIAKQAVDAARCQVADLLNAQPNEIVWTSGATEANNLALKGAASLYKSQGKHIITLKTEHPAVLECCEYLEKKGFSLTYLSPMKNGILDLDELKDAIREDTILVSIMHVNNETGVIQDIHKIAKLVKSHGALFHVDAAQSAGKLKIDLQKTPIDLLSLTSHKVYGPKGIGALFVRQKPKIKIAAQIHGGRQENGMRSGTLATHQIVGMGEALSVANLSMQDDFNKLTNLRQKFIDGLNKFTDIKLNADLNDAYPGILNLTVGNRKGKDLIKALSGVCFSIGSACASKGIEPSYVLRSMGQTFDEAGCAVRFSFGRFTCEKEILEVLRLVEEYIGLPPS